ncbi:MAG: ABC transporter substrate-binding protein [Deltaproteobacteria bacterium]|nr:ABC transporter substrate-binding protein [Deltaproteobacteria bacterium]
MATTSDTIKIGVSLPKTGRYAKTAAVYYSRAYDLWLEQVNRRGGLLGKKVELRVYDDESQPARVAEHYKRLIHEDKVDLLLGPCHSVLVEAMAPLVEESHKLLLQGSGSSHELFRKGRQYLFLCWSGCDFDYPKSFMEFTFPNQGKVATRRAALTYTNGRIGNAVALGVKHYAPIHGVQLVQEEIIGEVPVDYAALMARVKDSNPDVVLVGLDHVRPDKPMHECVTHALKVGIRTSQIWLSDNPAPRDLQLGDAINGVFMRGSWVPESNDPLSRDFTARFNSAYGSNPEYHSAGGYACCQVLERVVQHTGSTDNDTLRENLLKLEFDTVMGRLRFGDDGLPLGTIQLCQWQNGKVEVVYPESAKTRDAIKL